MQHAATTRINTIVVHAGTEPDVATGAVVPPIHTSTTFARREDGTLPAQFIYARTDNPTRRSLEACLAALEGVPADNCMAFASGLAATGAILQSMRPGDHVLAPASAYYGTSKWLTELLGPWGLETSFVDMTSVDAVRHAVRPNTRLFWIETPSNPTLEVTDIAAIAEVAHAAGATAACDNTWATPLLQRPFELGCDFVLHSTTKYMGGHSDVTGGAVLVSDDARNAEMLARIRSMQTVGGAVPSAFDCWLLMRGIRSLACRMRAHCDNAERVAEFLAQHSSVERVHYPGLKTDPGHAVASRQMSRFGGMLSVQIKGGAPAAIATANRVRLFLQATSLGGTESLIEHRASVEGPTSKTPPGLLRLSIGLEDCSDLIEDLAQALGD
jgi:Cystathionine beta-lyases/cystathionine gamma-synthases